MMAPQIAVRNMRLPTEAEAYIRKRIDRLSRSYARVMRCRVTVAVPTRRRRSDAIHYGVRIDLTLPRGEIVVDRQPREELRTAVQQAFDAARRRLRRHAQRLRGDVKTHEPLPG